MRKIIDVRGVVQGVGFRPFVYRLAHEHSLTGWVLNHSGGVEIEVQGPAAALSAFVRDLEAQAPPLARIPTHLPRYRHLPQLPARVADPVRPLLSLPLHQLHQLWPALYHHRRHPL